MSFHKRFKNWVLKMQKKSEEEKHVFAVTAALFLGAIVTFFLVMHWYFVIVGVNPKDGLYTRVGLFVRELKDSLDGLLE